MSVVLLLGYIVTILLVVLVHEAGHFTAAKAFGIKVEEFFVGFGPRVWSFRRGETEYGLKAIPAGGYVRIAGMNPFQEIPEEDLPRTYGAKPAWQRALVILAGPVTHFAMAFLALAFYFVVIGSPSTYQAVIAAVDPTLNGQASPATVAGLRPGDVVVGVDGNRTATDDQFVSYTRSHVGEPITLTVLRDGRTLTVQATPVLAKVDEREVGRLGVTIDRRILTRQRVNPITGMGRAGLAVGSAVKLIVERLGDVFGPKGLGRIWDLIRGAQRTTNDVGSVVGGARLATEAAQTGAWDFLLELFVSFNLFVGILNLLPLPPLDGGHLAVVVAEKVTRRKVDPRALIPLTALVAGFLVLLMISLVYLDIVNPIPNPFR